MPGFLITKQIDAPVTAVFEVLIDHAGYAAFTPLTVTVERPGSPDPGGVGAIRKLAGLGLAVREEIYRVDAPTHLSYGIISGAPVKDHRGDIVLEERAGGTFMTYRVTFDAPLPLRPIMLGVMRGLVGQLAAGIAKTAQARALSTAASA